MADFREQRGGIKFCFKLGKTATECYAMLKAAFGEQAMGRSHTFQWFSRFAPNDLFLFPKLKMKLNGRRFQTVKEIQAESQAFLNTLRENDFQECFKNWQRRWDRCQASEGGLL